jgi:hypothetical protein
LKEIKKGRNTEDPGHKFDFGKLRWDLIPYDSLEEIVKVYTHGAEKYTDHNWRKGMKFSRLYAAIFRHLTASIRGEDIDKDSGLNHLSQVAWGCLTLLNFMKTKPDMDDRIKDLSQEITCSHHMFENGICTECGFQCKHNGIFVGNFCSICGIYCV